ncbi:MAG: cell wall-active antibiotics response protein LiaF [Anaerolineaceae bacterium]|nr:cell wall-active antibiotics response protein LiaF [Anaerolineaceae bacterium]
MKNRTAIFVGSILIILGMISIIDALFGINLWSLLFPLILIALGFFIIFRPKALPDGTNVNFRFVGETDKTREWNVEPAEYWNFVGDYKLDLTKANIPYGETNIIINGFVNDVEIVSPTDAGLNVLARGFVHSTKIKGYKEDHFLSPTEYKSPEYSLQPKKVRINFSSFVSDIEID